MLIQKIRGLRGALRRKEPELEYPAFLIKEPRYFVDLPSLRNIRQLKLKYPLLEPFAFARIEWSEKKRALVYYLEEPKLTADETKTLHDLESALSETLDIKLSSMKSRHESMNYLHGKVTRILKEMGLKLPYSKYINIMYYIIRNFVGLNEIEALMHDPYIEDIGVDGVNSPIYITHRKFGTLETNVIFKDFDYLSNFVVKVAERCGRYISYASPLLDGSLPDGSRVQASLTKDVTTKGPTFSIRKFRKNPYSPVDLANLKTLSTSMLAYLWFLVEHNVSILICGGVSTGKTTFLNVLSMFIPPEDKIISIEDTREINLPHSNWIPSVSRTGFGVPEAGGKKYGEIDLFDLLRESFRQNPDYVIVGEVRGKEAYVMFQGMASGHPSMGTIHAGSVEDVIKRLETPPIELSPSLVESLDVIVVLVNAKEFGESARRVKEIVEIRSVDPRSKVAHTIKTFGWIPVDDTFNDNLAQSELIRRVSFEQGEAAENISQELNDRRAVLEWMRKYDVVQFDDVCGLVNIYYKDKKSIMDWVKRDVPPSKLKEKVAEEQKTLFVTGLRTIK